MSAARLRQRHIQIHREAERRRRTAEYWWEKPDCGICRGAGSTVFCGKTTPCPNGCSR